MVVHDYNWILGSEAALDCVAGECRRSFTARTRRLDVAGEGVVAYLLLCVGGGGRACGPSTWNRSSPPSWPVATPTPGSPRTQGAPRFSWLRHYSILGLLLLAAAARAPQDLAHALVSAARRRLPARPRPGARLRVLRAHSSERARQAALRARLCADGSAGVSPGALPGRAKCSSARESRTAR